MQTSADLLVVSHVVHYTDGDTLFGYGPYVLEIDMWAQLFRRVVIAAPCRHGPPPGDYLPFSTTGISIHAVSETGGVTLSAKLKQLVMLPKLVVELCSVMKDAAAIHVRCPGNLGLLGVLLAPLFSKRRIAKYAGQWGGFPGEPWTVALQRWLLSSRWWGAPVTIYGAYPDQPSHVISFFTSILDDSQMERARHIANSRQPLTGTRLRVLYVGRLSRAKNVDVLIEAVAKLLDEGELLECTIVGDGPDGDRLRELVSETSAANAVHFVGALEHESVMSHYENSDVLVLASETEGWPKAVAEAMAFGLVCIGSNRGFLREMLSSGRGLIVAPRDVAGLATHLRGIVRNPAEFTAMRLAAAHWSQRFTLSGLRGALRELLEARWTHKLQDAALRDCTAPAKVAAS